MALVVVSLEHLHFVVFGDFKTIDHNRLQIDQHQNKISQDIPKVASPNYHCITSRSKCGCVPKYLKEGILFALS